MKPGITKLAQLTQLPVNSFYLLPQRAWVLRSWDALMIPKPFSRVVMVWGRPMPWPDSREGEEQARLAAAGTIVRVFLPYGAQWYGYLMRRLAERPANVTLLGRALVGK